MRQKLAMRENNRRAECYLDTFFNNLNVSSQSIKTLLSVKNELHYVFEYFCKLLVRRA